MQINTPKKTSVDSLKSIRIICTNLNDVEVPAAVNLTIEKLQSPGKFFRERYWPQPDQYLMSQTEYFANFPEDVYRDENEISHYPIAEKLLDKTDSTNKPWLIAKPFKAGWYKLTATAKDNYGKLVTAITYLQLYDNDNNSATTAAISFYADKKTAVPGEQINYRISTGFKNIWLIQNISKMDNTDNISYQSISYKKWYNNSIDIQEKDRGGIAIDYIFVQHNRVYRGSEILAIPWSNKNLNIAYSSFRDKLLPGSNIQLTLKITGSKSEKVSSEILAAMYDASLDQFKIHQWPAIDIWPTLSNINNFTPNGFTIKYALQFTNKPIIFDKQLIKTYDKLLFSPQYLDRLMDLGYGAKRKNTIATAETEISQVMDNELSTTSDIVKFTAPKIVDNEARLPKSFGVTHGAINAPFTVRKNFAETAFFFPELHTDSTGSINFSFTIPEALTEWKLMVLAHSKSLATAYSEKKIITQKPLMVQPNTPRFLREGDRIELNSKLVNLSDQEITGTVLLELIDATTNKPVDGWFKNIFATQYFTVTAGQSSLVKFPVTVPFNFNSAITFRVTAQTTNGNVASGITHFSDGEEMTIPVLTNRILVTESLPINMRNQTTKKFSFQKLLNSDSSETLTNHALTVEFSSNPIWYAVQA